MIDLLPAGRPAPALARARGTGPERAMVVAAALAGLAGVALSAAAAHVSGPGSLDVAARFLLVHAPVLLGLAAVARIGLVRRPVALGAGAALALGLVLFCGDLAWRALVGSSPVPMAAPAGGIVLLAGWVLVAAAALPAER